MSNVWERFENIVSKEDVAEAKSQFEPIAEGTYKVTLESIAPAESKGGLPMLKGKFKIVDENKFIFYNQMLQNINNPTMTAVNVNEANKFVNKLSGDDVEFDTLSDLAKRVTDIGVGTEYTMEVKYGQKDVDHKFPKLSIVGKEVTPMANIYDTVGADDLPF